VPLNLGSNGDYFDPAPFQEKPHKCDKPDPDIPSGKAWRCNVCGKAYIKRSESQHGESWSVWERFPQADDKKGLT